MLCLVLKLEEEQRDRADSGADSECGAQCVRLLGKLGLAK